MASRSTSDQLSGQFYLNVNDNGLAADPVNHTGDLPEECYWNVPITVIYRAALDADGILRLYSHLFDINGNSNATIEWFALINQWNFTDEEGCQRKEPTLVYNITNLEKTKLGGLAYEKQPMRKEDCRLVAMEEVHMKTLERMVKGSGFSVGIWLLTVPEVTIVWTASLDDPPVSPNAKLQLTKDGIF
ncbi:hypothetical protein Pint_27148 [Pistacia integerrima]|uniref:Uncharacterized protein n=1 Tax=Pistacia integerrima TaxID=434235 RepID=A0ACC0YUR0_9ROSI|nr:hypothetical protein Pint_27148 [Pistacia integerrima]